MFFVLKKFFKQIAVDWFLYVKNWTDCFVVIWVWKPRAGSVIRLFRDFGPFKIPSRKQLMTILSNTSVRHENNWWLKSWILLFEAKTIDWVFYNRRGEGSAKRNELELGNLSTIKATFKQRKLHQRNRNYVLIAVFSLIRKVLIRTEVII